MALVQVILLFGGLAKYVNLSGLILCSYMLYL